MVKLIVPEPGTHFWRVKLTETMGLLTFEGWTEHIPAKTKKEAGLKAMRFYLRRYPGSKPTFLAIEREPYDRGISI